MIELCCVVCLLILLATLITLAYGNTYKKKYFNDKKTLFFVILILIFSLFLIIGVAAKTNSNITYNKKTLDIVSEKSKIKKFDINKVIIVGDSRMEFIEQDKSELDVPNNFIIVAKGGAKIDWTAEVAIPKLKELLEKNKKYNVHVVFNMGVNDLNYDIDIKARVDEYFELYKRVINEYKNVKFYFLSVNPVDEDIINDYWNNIRTNDKIEEFNDITIDILSEKNYYNVTYCDSYNTIKFETKDGLHYNFDTNKRIINFINNKCVEYK